jgi:hypothetical protein
MGKKLKYYKLKNRIDEKRLQIKKENNHRKSIHFPFIKLGSVIDFEKNINNLMKMNYDFIINDKYHS